MNLQIQELQEQIHYPYSEIIGEEEIKQIRKVIIQGKKSKKAIEKVTQDLRGLDVQQQYTHMIGLIQKQVDDISKNNNNINQQKEENAKFRKDAQNAQGKKKQLEELQASIQRQINEKIEQHQKLNESQQKEKIEQKDNFQTKIQEIQTQLEKINLERMQKLREEEILKEKIQEIDQQNQAREKHYEIELKKKDLQIQVQKNELNSKLNLIENEVSFSQIYTNELEDVQKNEEKFRLKKDLYENKVTEMQDILNKTNNTFSTFRKTIERVHFQQQVKSQMQSLEQENQALNQRGEKSDIALLDLVVEYKKLQKDEQNIQKQTALFQNLLNNLQQKVQ